MKHLDWTDPTEIATPAHAVNYREADKELENGCGAYLHARGEFGFTMHGEATLCNATIIGGEYPANLSRSMLVVIFGAEAIEDWERQVAAAWGEDLCA